MVRNVTRGKSISVVVLCTILAMANALPGAGQASQEPLLVKAVKDQDIARIKALLDEGEDVNVRFNLHVPATKAVPDWDTRGMTPLLLEYGADRRPVTTEGQSALISAILRGRADIVELLLTHKPDLNQVTRSNI